MNGRQIAAVVFVFACLAALLFSYSSWRQKLSGMSSEEAAGEILSGIAATGEGQGGSENEESLVTEEDFTLTAAELAALSANTDESFASLLASRFEAGGNVKLLIVGSQAIEQGGNGGAARRVADSLTIAYKGFIEADIVSFAGTSREFIDQLDDLIDFNAYDAILLEPFTLNNNGRVIIEDEHRHILQIRNALQEVNGDAVLLVMPPQPIHRPNFYLTQIRSLQNFAEVRGIAFVDHWTAWPDVMDEKMLEYLDENSAPNDKGAAAWETALRNYFIGE